MANSLMYATQQGDLETVVDIINNQVNIIYLSIRIIFVELYIETVHLDNKISCRILDED